MDALTFIFAALTLASVIYFVISLLTGGESGLLEGLDIQVFGDNNFGCMVLAAFGAIFGAVGLLGTLSGWNLLVTLVAAAAIGVLAGRLALSTLRFVMGQESETIAARDLVGMNARVTIDTPEGKTGEAIMEGVDVSKYPVREVNGGALKRGDQVEVIEFSGGILYVKRKNA